MPVDGLDRQMYRSAKFGSWEQSQRLDAQVAAAGAEVGITFHHDRMKRTPNTLRGHVLLAAALKHGLEIQGQVAERLFQAYFVDGEDVGDPEILLGVADEFGIAAISRVEDLDSPELVAEVKAAERKVSVGLFSSTHNEDPPGGDWFLACEIRLPFSPINWRPRPRRIRAIRVESELRLTARESRSRGSGASLDVREDSMLAMTLLPGA
jgi:DSBA-like thioredoxin domain